MGLPHTVSSKTFNACAYTQKVVKFGKMMTLRGHEVIHYGHEDSDLICTEHVSVLTNKDFEISYGTHDWRKSFFKFNTDDHAYKTFFKNAIKEIENRKRKHDFILPFWGSGVRPICDAHKDLICVEPGIGYAGGHWARWKIFESYAIYHAYCGMKNVGTCNQDWYEVVIPNYFDLADFYYNDKKDDYILYTGRVYDGKGVNVAIQASERAGKRLIIAGQKEDGYKLPDHVEYVGYADIETRKKLMSNAKASILASMYVEPFGGVQIENLLSGTPTITTDWGSFAENNLHGITGYRCRTMNDFVEAINKIDYIKPINCRQWGENFSLENVAPMYEKYFTDVLNVHKGRGWYEMGNTSLFALEKNYPSIKKNKIDLIIPTMWKCRHFYTDFIKKYSNNKFIENIIIIDNNKNDAPNLNINKLKLLKQDSNIFVSESWNLGVENSTSNIICILNDDVFVDEEVFKYISVLDFTNIDIIGNNCTNKTKNITLSKLSYNKKEPIGKQMFGFGSCMFLERKKYNSIPSEIKIIFNDDYLLSNMKNIYSISSDKIFGFMCTTINSLDSYNVKLIMDKDKDYALKNIFK